MQPVTMVSAGCRAPRRVLFDARRFDALAFSEGFSFSRKRARAHACTIYPVCTVQQWSPVGASYVGRTITDTSR